MQTHPLEFEIRALLARYLGREVEFEAFHDQLVGIAWPLAPDHPVAPLVGQLEADISDLGDGILSEQELRDVWSPMVRQYSVTLEPVVIARWVTAAEPARLVEWHSEPVGTQS